MHAIFLAVALAAPQAGDPPAPVTVGVLPGSFLIPGTETSIRFGGRVKLDAIHDFGAIGSPDFFKTSTIPVPEADSDGNTAFQARDTRLHLETHTPSGIGDVRGYVEGNFFGTGDDFTLRHAYLQTDQLLAGQTWTNFMLIDSRPETLDFEGPDGSVFLRQSQVRWTQPVGENSHWTVALEDPGSDVNAPAGSTAEQVLPDLTGGVRRDWGDSHVYASGLVREIGYNGAASDSVVGWGANVSGRIATFGKDDLRFQLAYGEGIGRYIEDLRGLGLDAAPDANGDLEALPTTAGFIAYRHHWSEAWRSTATFSLAEVDNSAGQAADALQRTTFTALNLIWSAGQSVDIGVEYLHGSRKNNDGQDADVDRLMFSWIYSM